MKPVFEVEEVPGVLDTSKPVPDWVKPETTPRTGIIQSIRTMTLEQRETLDAALMDEHCRSSIEAELAHTLLSLISDRRSYVLTAYWQEEQRSAKEHWCPLGSDITLTITILLRHWQDAQIGEDVIDDINLRGCIGDYWDAGNPAGDKLRFQRITAEGRTLCWRRIA